MTTSTTRIAAAMAAVVDMASRLGARDIYKLPGCWEYQIDEQWWVALNGHREKTDCSHGYGVEPFDCVVEFNGFPAGSFNAHGGIVAAGDAANEQTFIAACELVAMESKES